jgi:hypothetical protein
MSKIYGNLTISTGIFISSIAASAVISTFKFIVFVFVFLFVNFNVYSILVFLIIIASTFENYGNMEYLSKATIFSEPT